METTVKFSSAIGYRQATVATVPNTETDAIILKSPESLNTDTINVGGSTQGSLYINFTKGSLTNCIVRLYGSPLKDPTSSDWFSETDAALASGVATLYPLAITLTADAKELFHFPLGANRAYKVTVQSTGTVTGSSITIGVGLRNN